MSLIPPPLASQPRLQDIGFAEFTTELVTEIFEALIEANIRQTEAYMTLVRAASESLAGFITRTATEIPQEEVDGFVAALPELKTGATLSTEDVARINDLIELPVGSGVAKDNREAVVGNLDAPKITAIHSAVRLRLAANRFELLREMVRQGILRIVVDNGLIETRLTFSTHRSRNRIGNGAVRTTDSTTTTGVSGSVGLDQGSLRSAVGRTFGVSLSGGVGTSRQSVVRVSSASIHNRDTSGSRVQIFGLVRINFKTDFVPLNQD